MSLQDFSNKLAKLIGRPSKLRPFICEGSPLAAEVFIVGYNPATRMDSDWWQHWDANYGYRKTDWFNAYMAHREKPSKTRAKIEEIVKNLFEYRVLEANIDARPSARKSEYPKPVTEPFDFLLTTCRPRLIIAHGTDAVKHLQSWKATGTLIECKHFIYVGHERTAEIIRDVQHALKTKT